MNDKGGLYSHFIPEEERQEYICDNGISTYPCVRREAYRVTPERKEAVRSLQRIHEREIYGTELYLFGVAGFSVDLREEVLRTLPRGARGDPLCEGPRCHGTFFKTNGSLCGGVGQSGFI